MTFDPEKGDWQDPDEGLTKDDEQTYAAPFEDESLESEDDDVAITQEALKAERDRIDAAASLLGAKPIEEFDSHDDERERLGVDLAWWREEEGTPPLDIACDLANTVCSYVGSLRKLAEHGMSLDAMPAPVILTHRSGPLVVAALQLLGTLHAHLRPDIVEIIKTINDATPVATAEEEEALAAAASALRAGQMQDVQQLLKDVFGGGEQAEQDAGLN